MVLPRNRYLADLGLKVSSAMLKRISSLILALMLGGSVLAGTARLYKEHVCEMAGMEMMPGMEIKPCCKEHEHLFVLNEASSSEECCVTIPPEPGSRGAMFNLRAPSFSIAVIHPAVVQSPLAALRPYQSSHSTDVFLPNLQTSYIRNLSLLI